MYYDRETQLKYIKRLLFVIGIVFLLIVLVIVILCLTNQKRDQLYRVLSVTDGDTINIEYNGITAPLRLIGVDAPETVDTRTEIQCFGTEASDYLSNLLTGKMVKIESDSTQDDIDKYNRLLRYVYLNNEDVGLRIISSGYGKEYTYNTAYLKQSEYKEAEASARNNKKGQWADGVCNNTGSEEKQETEPPITIPAPTQCLIKGNINKKGEKIYHTPGQEYYDNTIITESNGERWFCTEQEAIEAGWRKSKV